MELIRQKQDWDDLAAVDIYWAILADPARRFGRWSKREFFLTGEREIQEVMEQARLLGHPKGRDSALDFGCGVGRLTRALAAYFDRCLGVDISEKMLSEAASLNRDIPNARFVLNVQDNLACLRDDEFDLVNASFVLQHMPRRNVIRTYIGELCRVLRPEGLLVFQLPSRLPLRDRFQTQPILYRSLRLAGVKPHFLYQRLKLNPARMNFLPEREVVGLLARRAGTILAIEREENPSGVHARYFVTKAA